MERNCLNDNLKDHGIRSRSYSYNNNNTSKLKDQWNYISQSYVGGDQDCVGVEGFSWPPRSYTCNFCNREFRSAQALGGHMNVHRRDRARLRQSPPIMEIGQCSNTTTTGFNLNLLPNNFNPNPSNVSPPLTCTILSSWVSSSSPLSALSSSSPSFASTREEKKLVNRNLCGTLLIDPLRPKSSDLVTIDTRKSCFVAENLEGFKYQDGSKFLKKAEIVRLDLEIGVLSENSKEDLDLELRLGYC